MLNLEQESELLAATMMKLAQITNESLSDKSTFKFLLEREQEDVKKLNETIKKNTDYYDQLFKDRQKNQVELIRVNDSLNQEREVRRTLLAVIKKLKTKTTELHGDLCIQKTKRKKLSELDQAILFTLNDLNNYMSTVLNAWSPVDTSKTTCGAGPIPSIPSED